MTREQFCNLAEQVSAYARRHPRRYRAKVAVMAASGYVVFLGAVVLSAVVLIATLNYLRDSWFWTLASREPRLLVIAAALVFGPAFILYSLVRPLFTRMPSPAGRRVQRADAPALFDLIDEVLAVSRASAPHTVLLTWDFNASVVQRPRLGWLGWSQDFLLLGVPLMAALTPLQFKAVLAHEFAHLRGGHGTFGNWIYRLRAIWGHLLERLLKRPTRSTSTALFLRFMRWYIPRFNAYTYALARVQEFESDAWAAQVAGAQATSEMLLQLSIQNQRMQEKFWRALNARADQEREVPAGVFTDLCALLDQPADRIEQRRWLRMMLGAETDGTDTHPSHAERLAALGVTPTVDELDARILQPMADEHVSSDRHPAAARALLGAHLPEFLAELEGAWRVAVAPRWRQRHERSGAVRKRLAALSQEATAVGGEWTEKADWERTCLECELISAPEETTAVIARFVERWPQHPVARFTLGRLLLEQDDEAGIVHLSEAMRLDARQVSAGEGLLAAYLRRDGRGEEATIRRRHAIRQGDVLDAGQAERRNVTSADRFLPHGLGDEEIARVRTLLARNPRLYKVWVARKNVAHFPEHPWYVVICLFRWRWEFATDAKRQRIYRELRDGLTIGDKKEFYMFVAEARYKRHLLVRKVRAAAGSQVYPQPKVRSRGLWWGHNVELATPLTPMVVSPAVLSPMRLPPPLPSSELPPPLPQPSTQLPPPLPFSWPPPVPNPVREPVTVKMAALTAAIAVVAVVCLAGAYVLREKFGSRVDWQGLRQHWVAQLAIHSSKDAEAAEPIIVDPHCTHAEADRVHALHWAQRTMLNGYTDAGHHSARWDAAARAFIERSLPCWAGCRDGAASAADLVPQADAVLKLGCDDPLVLFLAGKVKAAADRQSAEASVLLSRAVEGFRDSAYPRGVACVAAGEFIEDCERRRDGTGQNKTAKMLWLAWFKQSLLDGGYPMEDQAVLADQLAMGRGAHLFEENRVACCGALDAAGEKYVAPWLRLWLSGVRHLADAWDARGGDVAANVTQEGWRGFAQGLDLARRDLVAAWQLDPHRPEAAATMIAVVMGESNTHQENERLWFDHATAAQLDYHPAYQKMMWALYPRWGGSRHAMLAFGEACARTHFTNTGVPLEFHYTLLSIGWDEGDPGYSFRDPQFYKILDEMFARYEACPLQAGHRVLFHGWHARAAVLSGRYSDAYELLRQVDFQLAPEVVKEMESSGPDATSFLDTVVALGGLSGPQALAAEEAIQEGRTDRALNHYRMAKEAAAGDARAVNYLQGKIAVLEAEGHLKAGDWVPFQPVAGVGNAPVGWTSKLGRWRVEADGSLTGQCGASGLMLVSDTHVGPNFELRGEMDFLPGAADEVQSGVVFGHPDFAGEDWRSWRLKRNGHEGSILVLSQHWRDGIKQTLPVPDHNTFVLQSWQGALTVMINGRVLFQNQPLAEGKVDADDALVGLGGYSHQGNTFAVRYRRLQLRRISAPPTALADVSAPLAKAVPDSIATR